MQIEPGAVGVWEIETFASSAYRLAVPADGRAFVTELPLAGDDAGEAPVELLAWGRFDEVSGLAAGIAVGESMVLVLSADSGPGSHITQITQPVVHILEDRVDSFRSAR
jgi:hypothetical protein